MLTAKLISIFNDFTTVLELLASAVCVGYRKEILFDLTKFIYYKCNILEARY